MKKILAMALAAVMLVAAFASCASMVGDPDAIENYTPDDLTDETTHGTFTYERGTGDTVYLAKYESRKTHGDEVEVPSTVVLNQTTLRVVGISNAAFYGLSSLTKVTIPASVTSIGDCAFAECIGLKEVVLEKGSALSSIGVAAFHNCVSLTSLDLGDALVSIDNYAFDSCSGLTSVTLPDTLVSLGQGAFGFCERLDELHLPASVTTIGALAFYDCRGLTTITLHDGIKEIGKHAFLLSDNSTLADKVDTSELAADSYVMQYLSALLNTEEETESTTEGTTNGGEAAA